jgi:hypothetical protein
MEDNIYLSKYNLTDDIIDSLVCDKFYLVVNMNRAIDNN